MGVFPTVFLTTMHPTNNTFTAESLNSRPASMYSSTVWVLFHLPCFWIEAIEAPMRAVSVAKPLLKECADISSARGQPAALAMDLIIELARSALMGLSSKLIVTNQDLHASHNIDRTYAAIKLDCNQPRFTCKL